MVFGKSTRLPGSLISSGSESALESADREDAHGIEFRRRLSIREKARAAFHEADNNMALRRACLRRTRPDRDPYMPGEWVMMWQPQNVGQGTWFGPLKVVTQEKGQAVWATMCGKLHRRAPEHVRPVCADEARKIPEMEDIASEIMPPNNDPLIEIPNNPPDHNNQEENNPNTINPEDDNQSQEQPDGEPEEISPEHSQGNHPSELDHVNIPINEESPDDDLVTTHLLCCDDEVMSIDPKQTPCAWRCEFEVPSQIPKTEDATMSAEAVLLATTEKKQRREIKLSTLSPGEIRAFNEAKDVEVKNWISTGTVSKILRNKLAPEQIMRCRWILTWKPIEGKTPTETTGSKLSTHKPKARLVVLGYMDPNITEIPRDSPTLGRQSKMLLLQLIASCGWYLGSFDIRAAFLQGKPQQDRVMGLEPVKELAHALELKDSEVCKLDKSAYGLIDAPYLWYKTLQEELMKLQFTPCPFDPCVFVLRDPHTNELAGALGIHVDDGIYGGNEYFHSQISKLEKKYPFGSKKSHAFTFTGIELQQHPNKSIELSQSKYVNSIQPIVLKAERKCQEESKVTEEERHLLRGLVGSLQYAAVHTRPDLSSALSHLQSQINSATVSTLLTANKVLHTAKKHSDVTITIQPISKDDVRFIAFSDASFASKTKPESHAGMIILATHKEISQNKSCPISPLSWGTKKIQRIVTSTLSAETSALSTTLDQLTWIRLYWAWILNPKINWQKPETINNLPNAISIPTFKATEQDLAITDCKSLYDLTTRTAVPNCQEFRTQLLARAIKDVLSEGIRLHWVHSGAQLADALTKVMEANFLRQTLRQGKYCLHDVEEVLKNRASSRNRLRWLKSTNGEMCTLDQKN